MKSAQNSRRQCVCVCECVAARVSYETLTQVHDYHASNAFRSPTTEYDRSADWLPRVGDGPTSDSVNKASAVGNSRRQ